MRPPAAARAALAAGTAAALLAAACSLGCSSDRAARGAATPAPAPAPAAPRAALPPMPEGPSGWTSKPGWTAPHFMVAAAHPLATDAGDEILRAGGSALDAAIAVQMVLGLVEPQSSGIGGGAFLMHWDGRQVAAWDGRETAPAAAEARMFLGEDGKPLPHAQAALGGRAVATPGALKMLEAAHRVHGRLPWARLFEPAIALAERGFALGPRLHAALLADKALRRDPLARAYFYRADGTPHAVGHVLRNPALAEVLRGIAARGSDALLRGPVAADMVARVRGHAVPGRLSLADLAAYEPRRREALCTPWREVYRVCGFPPPSSGHLAVMQILGMLEHLPAPAAALQGGVPGPDWLHTYTEAARLAWADRAKYVADPDFIAAPGGDWRTLLDRAYLAQRAALIGARRMRVAPAGQPGATVSSWAPMREQPEQGTSHISVVDADGHAVAMTTTIEAVFGAHLMADGGSGKPGGYLLNNEMTDFALVPADAQGRPVANRIEPGKRSRSSMSPTLVFDARDGRLLMSLGSPGGVAIVHYVAKTLVATLQWKLDAQRAIDVPNFGSFGGPVVLERGLFPPQTLQALRARGHEVVESDLTSGLQAIQRTPAGWFGGADPRREGTARGR
jgi:gamma-glutamyltranspeptidase/glutathione hydrolase